VTNTDRRDQERPAEGQEVVTGVNTPQTGTATNGNGGFGGGGFGGAVPIGGGRRNNPVIVNGN
jgi:hypothetical protein